jgi:hypothetical protein
LSQPTVFSIFLQHAGQGFGTIASSVSIMIFARGVVGRQVVA